MRTHIMVCVAVVALATSACGRGTPSTPTRTPTELPPLLAGTVTALAAPTRTPVPTASPDTSPPFTITGPMDQAVALTEDALLRAGNYFVLDLQSRLVYVITPLPRPPDSGGRVGISVRWLSENELGVAGTDAILYAARLDGSVSRVGSRAEPTVAPAQALSADRAWSAAMDLGQNYADVVVAPAVARRHFVSRPHRVRSGRHSATS